VLVAPLAPQRAHCYADVDDPRIKFLARHQPTPQVISNYNSAAPWASKATASAPLDAGDAPTSDRSGTPPSASTCCKDLVLQASRSWEDVAELDLFRSCQVGLDAPVFPKTYVPFRDLLDSTKKLSAASQATPLCTAWMIFSAGAQVDSIFILNSSLSLAVQLFSDGSRAPRLRTITATKPVQYNICNSGDLAEIQNAALPPLWTGDPRFLDSIQCVAFASWSFWREYAPAASLTSATSNMPSFCTACCSSSGRAFRFHFLSNGELIVIGRTSGFICRGTTIITDREVYLAAFHTFKTSSESLGSAVLPDCASRSQRPKFGIYCFCQMAASFENLPAKSAWKSGENLYDMLIISNWAANLNKLVTRAALDIAPAATSSTPRLPKRQKRATVGTETCVSAEQTWEEYQVVESQRERDDRLYAQKLQDQELAALRLSALRSRRENNSNNNMNATDQELQIPFKRQSGRLNVTHTLQLQDDDASHPDSSRDCPQSSVPVAEEGILSTKVFGTHVPIDKANVSGASPIFEGSSTFPSSPVQSDAISDSDTPRSLSLHHNGVSAAALGHKIRFVFKNGPVDPPVNSDITTLRFQNLHEVFCACLHSRVISFLR
jgi:hypothetical protein